MLAVPHAVALPAAQLNSDDDTAHSRSLSAALTSSEADNPLYATRQSQCPSPVPSDFARAPCLKLLQARFLYDIIVTASSTCELYLGLHTGAGMELGMS
ncbi:hypothetical protein Hypma_005349 [Hypsizygus marmoreus]|uniref:Uncharacterized protein n=1 Tax=Hypsizygus marmoreus TaxID=39966 RepID=A0A369JYK7_HYPMA|nr:hypothetical protein Hypma_005349 [Hypsizygus marmoreus]